MVSRRVLRRCWTPRNNRSMINWETSGIADEMGIETGIVVTLSG